MSVSSPKFPILWVSWEEDAVSPTNDFLSLYDYRIIPFPKTPPLVSSPQTLKRGSRAKKPSPLDVSPKKTVPLKAGKERI